MKAAIQNRTNVLSYYASGTNVPNVQVLGVFATWREVDEIWR